MSFMFVRFDIIGAEMNPGIGFQQASFLDLIDRFPYLNFDDSLISREI